MKSCDVYDLPPGIRRWLEDQLLSGEHDGYDAISIDLATMGYDIPPDAINEMSDRLNNSIQSMRDSVDSAKLIARAIKDEGDDHTAATILLVQAELFRAMKMLHDCEIKSPVAHIRLLTAAARAVSDASKTNIGNKRWQDETRAKLDALEAKEEKTLDAETLRRVREALYGG